MNSPQAPTCEHVLDLLYLYVTNELESEEASLVESHVSGCDTCQKALAEHQVLNRALPTGMVDRKLFYYSKDA